MEILSPVVVVYMTGTTYLIPKIFQSKIKGNRVTQQSDKKNPN